MNDEEPRGFSPLTGGSETEPAPRKLSPAFKAVWVVLLLVILAGALG